ncbi:MAG: PAS domain-containing protein [Syntrophothermus sp.]
MTSKIEIAFDLIEKLNDMYLLLARDGMILKMNRQAKTFFNKEFQNKNFFDFIDTKQKESFINLFLTSIKENKKEKYLTRLNIDKSTYNLTLDIIPVFYDDVTFCLILLKEINEEKQKELDLMKFFYVAENTVNPLQLTDVNGKMIYVNPAFVAASGYSKEELLGKNPSVFSSGRHTKKFWARMWDTINSGKVWFGEVENKKKTGEPFYTQLLISPIIDQDGLLTGFFGVHRDLSEKRILEKQLIHTQKMESIGTLAAGIAHEVGNPLASISAIVQVVQRSTDDDFVKEKLGLVKSQVTRISKIIRDLVDFSRPSNYELIVTDINQNLTEAVEITKVGSKLKNIKFNLELNKNIPPLPLISDQLQQIFVNILLNAVDAISEKKEQRVEERISIKSDMDEDDVIITFSDTGPGISEENYTKIFEPFFTTKKEGKGTGLGLWVSYGIIKSFQGDIKVTSKLGAGTTFTLTIPIKP